MPRQLKRLARKQLAKATAHLKALAVDHDEAIHEARSRFKKARSVLRLLRGSIGEQIYRRENACYREAGRWLSGLRDATVVNLTLDNLSKRYPRQLASVDLTNIAAYCEPQWPCKDTEKNES